MNGKDLASLQRQIKAFGFPERLTEDLPYHISINKPEFTIYYHKEVGEDQLMYKLSFSKEPEGSYQFMQYELTLKNSLKILLVLVCGDKTGANRLSFQNQLRFLYFQQSHCFFVVILLHLVFRLCVYENTSSRSLALSSAEVIIEVSFIS